MKFVLFVSLILSIAFIHYANTKPLDGDVQDENVADSVAIRNAEATTPWWTRTFPIRTTVTRTKRPPIVPRTPLVNVRVSKGVLISIPVVLFALTFIIGFGLIAYRQFYN